MTIFKDIFRLVSLDRLWVKLVTVNLSREAETLKKEVYVFVFAAWITLSIDADAHLVRLFYLGIIRDFRDSD